MRQSVKTKKNMTKHSLLIFIFIFLSFSITAFADTTYTETEIVDKQKPKTKPDHSSQDHDHYQKIEDRDDGNGSDDFLSNCLCSNSDDADIKDIGIRILTFPLRLTFCGAIYGFGKSNAFILSGSKYDEMLSEKRSRFGISLGIGAHTDFNTTAGAIFNISALYYLNLTDHFKFREQIIFFPSVNGIYKDFKKECLVNNVHIGTQYDETLNYSTFNLTFSSELLFSPKGEDATFYVLLGAAPVFRYASTDIIRTTDYNSSKSDMKITDRDWLPSFSAGFGRYIGLNQSIGYFEIVYRMIINDNKKVLSLPGDNNRFTHSLLFNWGVQF